MGCRVQGAGCRVQGSGCGVQGSGFRVWGAGFRVQGVGGDLAETPHVRNHCPARRVHNLLWVLGFRVGAQGLGFRDGRIFFRI